MIQYSVVLGVMCLWMAFLCLPGMQAPIGNFWWDYLALKGLESQIFQAEQALSEIWLPFLLPPLLFKFGNAISGFGVDFMVAHLLIGFVLFSVSYHAVYTKGKSKVLFPLFLLLALFLVWPVSLDPKMFFSYKHAKSLDYTGIYNRYLDVAFCLIVVRLCVVRELRQVSVTASDVLFWSAMLLIALSTKLSYFCLFFGFCWAEFLLRSGRAALVASMITLIATAILWSFLPNYFTTVIDIAEVRGLTLDGWAIWLLLVAGVIASVLVTRLSPKLKEGVILSVPLLAHFALSQGNYGDLNGVRLAFALMALAVLARLVGMRSVGVTWTSEQSDQLGRVQVRMPIVMLAVATLSMAYPFAVLAKTGVVTTVMMVGNYFNVGDRYVRFNNIPGFFTHPIYYDRSLREKIASDPTYEAKKEDFKLRHTASHFAFYAGEIDSFLDLLKPFDGQRIAWFSFPGMVPEVLGVGKSPVGGRPWYLFMHEIDENNHPDFLAINENSDVTIIDDCNWANWDKMLANFQHEIYVKKRLIFKNDCFAAYDDEDLKYVADEGKIVTDKKI